MFEREWSYKYRSAEKPVSVRNEKVVDTTERRTVNSQRADSWDLHNPTTSF